MIEINGIEVDEKKANLLLQKLILLEKKNIMLKQDSDAKIVEKIKKMIQEEVECF